MKTDIFLLSSGVEIEFRQIMLREESFLAKHSRSRKMKRDKLLSEVMNMCCNGVVNPGPYPFLKEGDKPQWEEMLRGDRFIAMLKLRMLSYRDGHEYDVDLRCPMCNEKFTDIINLRDDLHIQNLPAESVAKIKSGEPFETTIAGKKVYFHLPLGKTEKLADKILRQNPGRDMAAAIRARIVDVEGVERRDILDWLDGQGGGGKFEGLTSDDAEDLRNAFDSVDGGVDTEIEAECPATDCGHIWDYDLPFDKIFMPSREIRERRRKLRRGKALLEDSQKKT